MPNKSVVATADNAASSLRSGRLTPAVPHFKRSAKSMSQVLFFSLPEDEAKLLDRLICDSDSFVVDGRFLESEFPAPVSSASQVKKKEALLFPRVLTPRVHLPVCVTGEMGGLFTADFYRQPFAELSLSTHASTGLVNGRLYAKIGWLPKKEDNVIFKRWFDRISRMIRKETVVVRSPWRTFPHAKKWFVAGGTFCLGDAKAMQLRHEEEPNKRTTDNSGAVPLRV